MVNVRKQPSNPGGEIVQTLGSCLEWLRVWQNALWRQNALPAGLQGLPGGLPTGGKNDVL